MKFNKKTMDAIKDAKKILDSYRDHGRRLDQVEQALGQRKMLMGVKKNETDRKKMFLTLYKLASGCAMCGANDDPVCLDIDHIDRENKRYSIGDLPKKSWGALASELAKCQVLCAVCHRLKTEAERLTELMNIQEHVRL